MTQQEVPTSTVDSMNDTESVRPRKDRTLAMLIRERLQGRYPGLFALVALELCMVLPGLLVPIFSQIFIDDILLSGNNDWLPALLAIMAGTALFHGILYRYWYIVIGLIRRSLKMIRTHEFVHHMLRLPMHFYNERYTGDLVNRLDNEHAVNTFLVDQLVGLVSNVLVAVFYLVILVLYSPTLTAVGLVIAIFNLVFIRIVSNGMAPAAMRAQDDGSNLFGALYSGLQNIRSIKAAGAESGYVARLLREYACVAADEQELGARHELLDAVPQIAGQVASVVTLLLGAVLVIRGEMTPGMLVAYVSLLSSFMAPLKEVASFAREYQLFKADMASAEDILACEEDVHFREASPDPRTDHLTGEVTLEHVTFGYDGAEEPLIQDLSLHLDRGSLVAFVGDTGCGKSAIARLVSGLYQPQSGEIRIDGIPVNRIPKEVFSTGIATVTQEITIFSGSIRENLTLWNEGISEVDLIRASKDACLHEIVTCKPGAYEYPLLENGANLSGGERQRLEIARALVTNPGVLILDEATRALDPMVEKQIIDHIPQRGCTCILVTHRLSAVRDCDEIYVMSDGRIVQHGTHDELAAGDGPYRQIMPDHTSGGTRARA